MVVDPGIPVTELTHDGGVLLPANLLAGVFGRARRPASRAAFRRT
ncbi:hypothetical protein [Streptomyces sp. NPDC020681]